MTAVLRVLPRDWDGARLLRFLTGLAMLALAFTAHLQPMSEPAAPPPAVAEVASPSVTVAQPVVTPPLAVAPALSTPVLFTPPVPAVVSTAVLLLVAGFALRVRGERAPPTA